MICSQWLHHVFPYHHFLTFKISQCQDNCTISFLENKTKTFFLYITVWKFTVLGKTLKNICLTITFTLEVWMGILPNKKKRHRSPKSPLNHRYKENKDRVENLKKDEYRELMAPTEQRRNYTSAKEDSSNFLERRIIY